MIQGYCIRGDYTEDGNDCKNVWFDLDLEAYSDSDWGVASSVAAFAADISTFNYASKKIATEQMNKILNASDAKKYQVRNLRVEKFKFDTYNHRYHRYPTINNGSIQDLFNKWSSDATS